MKIKFLFAWYDLWIGIYIDRFRDKVYILPLPMMGIVIEYSKFKWWYQDEIRFNFGTLSCFFKGHKWKSMEEYQILSMMCEKCHGYYDLLEPPFPSFHDLLDKIK